MSECSLPIFSIRSSRAWKHSNNIASKHSSLLSLFPFIFKNSEESIHLSINPRTIELRPGKPMVLCMTSKTLSLSSGLKDLLWAQSIMLPKSNFWAPHNWRGKGQVYHWSNEKYQNSHSVNFCNLNQTERKRLWQRLMFFTVMLGNIVLGRSRRDKSTFCRLQQRSGNLVWLIFSFSA